MGIDVKGLMSLLLGILGMLSVKGLGLMWRDWCPYYWGFWGCWVWRGWDWCEGIDVPTIGDFGDVECEGVGIDVKGLMSLLLGILGMLSVKGLGLMWRDWCPYYWGFWGCWVWRGWDWCWDWCPNNWGFFEHRQNKDLLDMRSPIVIETILNHPFGNGLYHP